MMKRSQLKLNQGGLMRCCTDSAAKWVEEDPQADVQNGDMIQCKYEAKETMTVVKGVICWLSLEVKVK